ncbi:MAG TPA: c-type cytochrome [Chitinophagaceae bacterium]|jgi:cytochrome c
MLRKILALSFIATACFACGNNSSTSSADTDKKESAATTAKTEDLSQNPVYKKGLEIIGKSDCLTCHKIDETSTGPAYRDVANKYPDNEATIDSLSAKIIAGGSGHWGTVPMLAHPALSQDDAKALVKYILLLKNK